MKNKLKTVEILINWDNIDSIKSAEKTKARLENKGYTQINSFGGMFTSVLIYALI